jgi:hypothetical protein
VRRTPACVPRPALRRFASWRWAQPARANVERPGGPTGGQHNSPRRRLFRLRIRKETERSSANVAVARVCHARARGLKQSCGLTLPRPCSLGERSSPQRHPLDRLVSHRSLTLGLGRARVHCEDRLRDCRVLGHAAGVPRRTGASSRCTSGLAVLANMRPATGQVTLGPRHSASLSESVAPDGQPEPLSDGSTLAAKRDSV